MVRIKQCWDEGWKTISNSAKKLTICHLSMMIGYTAFQIAATRVCVSVFMCVCVCVCFIWLFFFGTNVTSLYFSHNRIYHKIKNKK